MPEMDGIHRPAIQLAGSESDEFFPHIAPPDRSIRTHGNIHRIVFGKIEVAKWRKAAARILPDPPGLLHEKIPASAAAYGMAFSYGQSIDRIQVEDITPCQDHVQRRRLLDQYITPRIFGKSFDVSFQRNLSQHRIVGRVIYLSAIEIANRFSERRHPYPAFRITEDLQHL